MLGAVWVAVSCVAPGGTATCVAAGAAAALVGAAVVDGAGAAQAASSACSADTPPMAAAARTKYRRLIRPRLYAENSSLIRSCLSASKLICVPSRSSVGATVAQIGDTRPVPSSADVLRVVLTRTRLLEPARRIACELFTYRQN